MFSIKGRFGRVIFIRILLRLCGNSSVVNFKLPFSFCSTLFHKSCILLKQNNRWRYTFVYMWICNKISNNKIEIAASIVFNITAHAWNYHPCFQFPWQDRSYFIYFTNTEGRTGGVSVTKKIDASRIMITVFKFYFEALHVSLEICVSRITKNIFFKSRFSLNEMIWSRITKIPLYDPQIQILCNCKTNIYIYVISKFVIYFCSKYLAAFKSVTHSRFKKQTSSLFEHLCTTATTCGTSRGIKKRYKQ